MDRTLVQSQLIEQLPVLQRLALSYSPGSLKKCLLSWFALDCRLADLIRQTREPLLAQVKLAWWRENLSKPADERPSGEALFEFLADWPGDTANLVSLVDAWELLLLDQFDEQAAADFARSRVRPLADLCALSGQPQAEGAAMASAQVWVLADLLANLSEPGERGAVLAAYGDMAKGSGSALPRALRPITLLYALAKRSLAKGGGPLLDGPASLAIAYRVGIFGR